MAKEKISSKVSISNKKARFEYEIMDTYTAGIVLTGTEIKALRMGKASIGEAYCYIRSGEAWIKEMYIGEYDFGSYNNHEPRRLRKLLLNKREISKLFEKLKNKGFTLVPLLLFINDNGYAKVNIGVARGKKMHDKRNTLKDRDNKRQLDRIKKNY